MNDNSPNTSDALRRKAEDLLAKLPAEQTETVTTDILNVIHELHVHQIELELQNEELQTAYRSLEKSKSDYMRLYHQAPVGYVVLDQSGITRKVNKTFASMLDSDPAAMSGTPFADFLVAEDRAIFRARLKAFYKNPFEKQIDVRLSQQGQPLYVSLRAIVNAEDLTEAGGPFTELLVTVTDISERHEYQLALEKSRADLEAILSSISDGFMALDDTLHILYFNSAAEQILKADRQDILGRLLFEAFPMARDSYFENRCREALEAGEVVHFETFFNESPFHDWFEITAYPYQGGLSVFFRVITERKLAERALKESEERFRSYIENSPYGVIVTTGSGDFRQVNPAICAITGFTADQILQKNMRDIFFLPAPPDKAQGQEVVCTSLATKEIRYIDKDASIGWTSASTVKIGEDRYLSFIEEISQRKRVEQDLSESQRALALYNRVATIFLTSAEEDIFHDVLDQLLDTFSCSYGYFGYINQEGELVCPTMTRQIWEKCEMADKNIYFPPSCWGGLWGRSLTEKKAFMANDGLTAPQGHIDLDNALAVPILNHDRLVGQFALANKADGFTQTDLKLLESTAKQTAPILQSLLDRLEKEKLTERLENTRRQLDKVESLNRMAAATAHNYNNLLTIIMGSIELALEELPDHEKGIRASLSDALKASQNGADIGAMLLMYLGHTVQGQTAVDLSRLTAEYLQRFEHKQRGTADIHFTAPQRPPIVAADPQLMERLLHSLLANAVESQEGRKGQITVTVDTRQKEQIHRHKHFPLEWQPVNGRYGLLEVTDEGCGIAADNIDKLFDPFYSEKFTGRGMGLAMVLGIVRIYNGAVTVDTGRGKGSVFRVYLPLAENGG